MDAKVTAASQFIASLELPVYESLLRRSILGGAKPTLKDDQKAGYVADGSLVSFVAGLAAAHKSDVLNSTLLAQLAANKKYDREKDTKEWYGFYRTVLENVGWVAQAFNFQKYHASGSTFTVDKVVVEILAAIATENEIAVVTETMNALKALSSGSGPLVLWDSSSHSASSGNFQIATCVESDSNVVMKNGSFYFSTSQSTSRFLWFSYSSSDMDLYKAGQSMTLNEDVYSQVRQQVIDKLGDRAQQFVADLDI